MSKKEDFEVTDREQHGEGIVTPMDEGWGRFTYFADKGEELKDKLEVYMFEPMSYKNED